MKKEKTCWKTFELLETAFLKVLDNFEGDSVELGGDKAFRRQTIRSAARKLAFGPAQPGMKDESPS